jgi:hypothetical protein
VILIAGTLFSGAFEQFQPLLTRFLSTYTDLIDLCFLPFLLRNVCIGGAATKWVPFRIAQRRVELKHPIGTNKEQIPPP